MVAVHVIAVPVNEVVAVVLFRIERFEQYIFIRLVLSCEPIIFLTFNVVVL